jgi:protein-ribulosamine 3-kinase
MTIEMFYSPPGIHRCLEEWPNGPGWFIPSFNFVVKKGVLQMNPKNLHAIVEQKIEQTTGQPARIIRGQSCGGGCINDARVIELEDGRKFFLKSNPSPLPGMFEREAEGLQAMARAEAIRVPKPIATGGQAEGVTPFIVMENIESGSKINDFQGVMGRQFARMHLNTKTDRYGFEHDNYLGSTPQPNTWETDWVEFWRKHRLGHQLELARKNGYADSRFNQLGDKLLSRLGEFIGQPREPACLLHGDLWSGNYMVGSNGEPVLIDPAAYCGRREADLSMTLLFGGFSQRFYEAYQEVWPLESGSHERLELYKLYHQLNHLNIFGTGYKSGCLAVMQRYGG